MVLPSRVGGRIKLFLGGGGRVVSLMLNDGRGRRSLVGTGSFSIFVDALRILSCRNPGAEGVLAGNSSIGLGLGFGNVSDRLFMLRDGGSKSSPFLWGGPKPPYPFLRGILGGARPALFIDEAVLGLRASSSLDSGRLDLKLLLDNEFKPAEGRRLISKGPGAILFILVKRVGACFGGLVPNWESRSGPSGSDIPPYPPGLLFCVGGGESAMVGPKKSSLLGLGPARPFGVLGDIA